MDSAGFAWVPIIQKKYMFLLRIPWETSIYIHIYIYIHELKKRHDLDTHGFHSMTRPYLRGVQDLLATRSSQGS